MSKEDTLDDFVFDPYGDLDWDGLEEVFNDDTPGQALGSPTLIAAPKASSSFSMSIFGSKGQRNSETKGDDFGDVTDNSGSTAADLEEFLKMPGAKNLLQEESAATISAHKEKSWSNWLGSVVGGPRANRKMKHDDFQELFNPDMFDDNENTNGIKAMRGGSLGRVIASSVAAAGSIFDEYYPSSRPMASAATASSSAALPPATTTAPALAASTSAVTFATKTPAQRDEARMALVKNFFNRLNKSDVNGLVTIIRECYELCVMSIPDVLDPITGRGDIMMLLSLLLEAYPDGVWTLTSQPTVNRQEETVNCTFRFMGTKIFDYPVNTLFRQIQYHMSQTNVGAVLQTATTSESSNNNNSYNNHNSNNNNNNNYNNYNNQYNNYYSENKATAFSSSSSSAMASSSSSSTVPGGVQSLINEVSEQATLTDHHHQHHHHNTSSSSTSTRLPSSTTTGTSSGYPVPLSSRSSSSNSSSGYSSPAKRPSGGGVSGTAVPIEENDMITLTRKKSLRETRTIETAVLKDGPMTYRRKVEFVFNENDQIMRIIFSNLL